PPGRNMSARAKAYQRQIAETFGDRPPKAGQEYKVDGRWFDGKATARKAFLEAKGPGYDQLFHDLVDNGITGPLDDAVKEIEEFADIAERHSYTLEVHVAEQGAMQRIKSAVGNRASVKFLHTPAQ